MEGGIQFLQEGPSQSHCPSPPILKLIFAVVFETIEVCETGGGPLVVDWCDMCDNCWGFMGNSLFFAIFFGKNMGFWKKLSQLLNQSQLKHKIRKLI